MLRTKKASTVYRAVIAALVLCLALGCVYMLDGVMPKAGAAVYTSNVASAGNWSSALSGKSSGDVVNITLTGDVTGSTALATIPSGVTVNLNMNGHTIAYDKETTSESIYASSYTSGTYASATYWGLIKNNGTLNITGTGTIRNKLVAYDRNDGERGDAPQKLAAIVNTGTLSLASGVQVKAYLSDIEKEHEMHDMFLYCVGIFNMGGTVTTSASIECGSFAASPNNGNVFGKHSSYLYSFVYGICGGTVTVNGGTINTQAIAGGNESSGTSPEGDHHEAFSIGVYSDKAKILGAPNITTKAVEYMARNGNDVWGDSVSFACGVLYTLSNYPVIGGGATIDAFYEHYKDKTTITVPGTNKSYSDCYSDDDCDTYYRRSFAVAGFSKVGSMTYGQNTSEQTRSADFFGNADLSAQSARYYGEEPYRADRTGYDYTTDATGIFKVSGSKNSHETHDSTSSKIANGAVSTSQYVIVNRYYNTQVSANNLVRASFKYDTNIAYTEPRLKNNTNFNTGLLSADASQNSLVNGSGDPKNTYYYELNGATQLSVQAGSYYNKDFSTDSSGNLNTLANWSDAGQALTATGVTPQTGTTPRVTIIFVNYIIKKASDINYVTASNGVNITNQTAPGAGVEMTYTGKTVVPGTDFQVKIFDKSSRTDVSNVYTVNGTLGGVHQNGKTGVDYSYVDSNGNTVNGLPKDAGVYNVTASVAADNTYASSNTYNRNGVTQSFQLTIRPADITCDGIADSYNGTYGSVTGAATSATDGIVPLYSFTAKGVNNERPAGTWTVDEQNTARNAGEYTSVAVTFTPSGADAVNYNAFTKYVSVIVAKRAVTLTPEISELTYGDDPAAVSYSIAFDTLAGADADKEEAWENNSDYRFLVNGQWVAYYKGLPAGTYPVKIQTFAGADDANNVWTLNEGTVTVNKAALTVTANDDAVTYGAGVPAYGIDDVVFTGWAVATDTPANSLNGSFTVTTNYTQGANVGTYKITPAGYTSNNYTVTFVEGTLTVGKKTVTVTPDAVTGMTYGATLPAITYSYDGFYGGDTSAVVSNQPSYSTVYVAGTSPVGTYTLTAVVDGLSATNYKFAAGTTSFAVAKATPVVTVNPQATITFTQTLADAVFANGVQVNPNNASLAVPGYYEFVDATSTPEFTIMTRSYDAIFVPADQDNYNTVTGLTASLTINRKEITGTPVISGSAMAGSTLTLSVAGMDPADLGLYDIQWTKTTTSGSQNVGGNSATYTVSSNDIGSTITVKVTAIQSRGYSGNATSAPTGRIIMALTPASAAQLDYTIPAASEYDGSARVVNAAVKTAYANYVGDVTVYYNGSATAPTAAGTYQVTANIGTPAEPAGGYTDAYYGPVSGLELGTITITPRTFLFEYTPVDKVYDGTTTANATVETSGKVGSDLVSYDQSRVKYTFDSAFVGVDKSVAASGVALTGADAGNYVLQVRATGNAAITKATLTAVVTAADKVYDGSPEVQVSFSNVDGYKGSDSAATVQVPNGTALATSANAGTWYLMNISTTLTGTSALNYELRVANYATAQVVIAQANSSYTFPLGATIEFSKPLSEARFTTEGSGDGTFAYEEASAIPESVGTYDTYYVVFTPTDSVNYKSGRQIVRLTVTTCTVNYNVAVSGTAQVGETLTASTSGLNAAQQSYLRYQWVRVSSDGTYTKIPNAIGTSYTLTDADQGYTVAVLTYFEAGSPFVYADGTSSNVGGTTGVLSGATASVKAITLSLWQRIVNWFRRLIAAISGIAMTISG